jgi:hypothetical protein
MQTEKQRKTAMTDAAEMAYNSMMNKQDADDASLAEEPELSPEEEEAMDEQYNAQAEQQHNGDSEMLMPDIVRDEQAEHHLRSLKRHQDNYAAVQGRFDTEIARLMARSERELQKIKRRISWHEGGLKAYYTNKGQKRLVLANATLSSVKGRPSVDVRDPELLETWCVETGRADAEDMFRRTVSPDKKKILAYIKETGEEPPGCQVSTGADTFKVKF